MAWVGWDEENEIPDHSLPPFLLQVPEVQKGLGSGKREALTWSRSNGTFSFLHMKQFHSLKVTERKAMGSFWIMAKGREWRTDGANWMAMVGKKKSIRFIFVLHLARPVYSSLLNASINVGKKPRQNVIWNHLWVVRVQVLYNAFFIFVSVFFKFSKIKHVHFYKNNKRHISIKERWRGNGSREKRRTKIKILKGKWIVSYLV